MSRRWWRPGSVSNILKASRLLRHLKEALARDSLHVFEWILELCGTNSDIVHVDLHAAVGKEADANGSTYLQQQTTFNFDTRHCFATNPEEAAFYVPIF